MDVFLLAYGIQLAGHANTSRQASFYANLADVEGAVDIIAVINDLPAEKEKTIKCSLKILKIKSDSSYKNAKGSIIAYFKKPVDVNALQAGNTLLIKTKLSEIAAPQNPYEFDYSAYLYNRQIYHTAFIDTGAFAVIPVVGMLNPLWQAGLACKKYVMARLKNSPLSDNAYNICCALLTGYDDEIDKNVMQAFSHSGTLHVLSVSGLHTGLIYLALSFLFDLLDRKQRYRLAKFIFITLVLWFFALITGFSAPVLRAVIMFNLFGLGKIYFRNDARNQVNILLVSAFILLTYNPFFITDIGFLLSYFALFGLIYFQPKLSANWQPANRLVNYTWQSITASFAATISTLPLTLFYFKQFPLWFFVCNLVVVPATFVILFLALLVVLKLNIAAVVTNYLTALLIAFINIFNSDTLGFIDRIHFLLPDVIYLTLIIVLISWAIQYRSYRLMVTGFALIIAWQFTALLVSYGLKSESLLSVYHLKKQNVVSVKNKTSAYISAVDTASYNFHIRPHLISFNYPNITTAQFNYIAMHKRSVLILNAQGSWPATDFSAITTLVLANNFKITEADLQAFRSLETIVADGSNNSYTIKKAEELSRKFGVNFYNTKTKGAYLLTL